MIDSNKHSILCSKGKITLPQPLLNYLRGSTAILRKEFSNESIAIFSEKAWEQLMQKIIEVTNRFDTNGKWLTFSTSCKYSYQI